LALQRLAQKAQAAARGEITPAVFQEQPLRLEVGKAAPDFLVPDWRTGQNVALRQFRGRPTLLLFLRPRSVLSGEVLLYARRLAQQNPEWDLRPVALFMEEDREAVQDLLWRRDWDYPVLIGRALRTSYDVEATPRIVLIDGQGVVQGQYTGWGPEIPHMLVRDLHRITEKK
jgi:cytochrome oxidase Cu insertion factor (SCO1/SenC/PrrC family)